MDGLPLNKKKKKIAFEVYLFCHQRNIFELDKYKIVSYQKIKALPSENSIADDIT